MQKKATRQANNTTNKFRHEETLKKYNKVLIRADTDKYQGAGYITSG